MSKPIMLTDEYKEQIVNLFAEYMDKFKMSDGKIKFEKELDCTKERATVCITSFAWAKIVNLINHFSTEVAWHCKARRDDKFYYTIYDAEVYPQIVSGATADSSDKYREWRLSHSDEEIKEIRCQCHSHVNMSVTPSNTDLDNNKEYLDQLRGDMFYIFMIWNKRLERNIKIYDMRDNVYFENSDIDLLLGEEAFIDDFLDEADKMVEEPKAASKPVSAAPVKTGTEYIVKDTNKVYATGKSYYYDSDYENLYGVPSYSSKKEYNWWR